MLMNTQDVKSKLSARASALLGAAGHSPPMVTDARREAANWVRARTAAASRRRGVYSGWGIVWTDAGHGTVELQPMEVPAAGRGEVTIDVQASIVSPGTERAYYLRLPNAAPPIPFRPGYSVAGRVIAVGPGVERFATGDLVAASGAPHASVATVSADRVQLVPPGVDLTAAATIALGVISHQGVAHARLSEGEPTCIVGAGLIGILTQRVAAAKGAGRLTVIAGSRRRETVARAGGAAEFLTADDERVAELDAPVVIEAAGSPSAVPTAIRAAGDRGRVVLLGSARGRADDLPVAEIRAKSLELIGAHVNTLDYDAERTGVDRRSEVAAAYLAALADRSMIVDDVIDRRLDPREAELFYRDLAGSGDVLGAVFDWSLLAEGERPRRSRLLRIPDISGRGADASRPLGRPARGRHSVGSLVPDLEPFEGAEGMLRFGIVGCGDIAVHNATAMAAAPNAALTACFDVDRSLAENLAGTHDVSAARSYDDLLGRTDVDAVFLSVPHHLHAPLAEQAAAAGKHVVVEKPPANDLRNAMRMVEAADEAGVALSVCFPQRYQADVVAARRLIEQGAVGEVSGVAVELVMDRSPAYRLGGFTGRSVSDWRDSREKAGGGVLIMNLSHYIDLLYHLTSTEAVEISAFGKGRTSEIEDSIAISLRLANGAPGSVIGTTEARGSLSTGLRIWGANGQVAIEDRPRFYTLKSVDDGLRTTRWQRFGHLPKLDTRAVFISRFATAIATGVPPDISGRQTLGVQAFMEAAYISMDTGRPMRPADLLAEVAA
jgi:predicted dehydrogenase/NADPH:quinone reductase-like Zn-dependent oxidoreductase